MKESKELQEWIIQHITENPNITWGSLYRDCCFTKFKVDNLTTNTKILVDKEIIIISRIDYNSYYNLGKQLQRNKILNKLGI